MLHFERSVLVDAPVAVVWEFHARPDALDLLMPPWQPVELVRRQGGLGLGAETEFRLWFGPVPLRWLAVHVEFEPHRLFADRQETGPFAFWLHRHRFEPLADERTRLTDAIDCELPLSVASEPLAGWWLRAELARLFAHRHAVTRRECERSP